MGVPTEETANRVYGHLDHVRAVSAGRTAPTAYPRATGSGPRRGGWFVVLRLHTPLPPFFDKSWRPGEIEAVG
ncbi:hypothetical protein P1P68_39060 [Streptomyces scabiei]|uniref:hypothetical protein n=1 Tax=Streptomyces scabiei TaxID=1930 RepID=UPI00298FDA73|nr:hypothetical protein [Streptomyces scabiei]MDW8810642.1 hypothetical protein [Streptomyces scabiei]